MSRSPMTKCVCASILTLVSVTAGSAQTRSGGAALSIPRTDGDPLAVWAGNGLVAIEGSLSAAPVLHVFDRSGAEVQRVAVQVPEAQLISIIDGRFTRSADGYLAAAGVAYGPNDHGDAFLAIISPDGARQTLVRTNGYFIRTVVFARDGNVWTAGLKVVGGREAGDYPIIQRFSRSGAVLGSALWRTRFPRTADLFSYSSMVASTDRVGWFSPLAGQYIEFSQDGKELANYQHSLTDTAGIALCDDNTVWVSLQKMGKPGEVQSLFYSLDRLHGTWVNRKVQSFAYLYGCSGTTLITTVSGKDLTWFEAN